MITVKQTLRDETLIATFSEKLETAFGVSFDVWVDGNGHWECSSDSVCGAQHEEIIRRGQPDGIGFVQPRIDPIEAGQFHVSVPHQSSACRAIAFAIVEAASGRYLLPLATAVQSEMLHLQQIDQLSGQVHPSAARRSPDQNKLVFLRKLADGMEISEDRQLRDLIEYFVPLLPTSIDCEWVAFVGSSDLRSRLDCVCEDRNTIISTGPRDADEETLVRLIAEFGGQAMTKPFVFNNVNQHEFSGVRQIILVRVYKRSCHWGWLIAGNKIRDDHFSTAASKPNQDEFGTNESDAINSVAALFATHAQNMELFEQKEDLVVNVVRTLVTAIEAKDNYTRGHSERVAIFARLLAKQLELSEPSMDRIYLTGLLHDIGKIGVPDATLRKTGELTSEEFEQIKRHPEIGWRMLRGLDPLKEVLSGVLHHHERIDGRGYPDGLLGEAIPVDGRILAVADAYDAMTSHRSYRDSLTQEEAERVLQQGAGLQWDSRVIEAFFEIMPEVIKIRQSYRQPTTGTSRRSKAVIA
jgi:response regulator RpfG family c-di-GMP phosphodiesterase